MRSLTVPGPEHAYAIGVDVDRGDGFEPAAMLAQAPPAAVGGSSDAQAPEVKDWLGTDPLRAQLDDLQTGSLVIRVRFIRLLRRYQGRVEFSAGVSPSPLRAAADALPSITTVLSLDTQRDLIDLETSGGDIDVARQGSAATLRWSSGSRYIAYKEESLGIHAQLLTHRTPSADPLGGTDGYFMLIIDANEATEDSAQARSLSLVIDRSGSMTGDKLDQAKLAARAMLDHLGPRDSFNIKTFDDAVSAFSGSPRNATPESIAEALEFIKSIKALNGTNLNEGIIAGLGDFDDEGQQRFDAMVLLSDGLATTGVVDRASIHDNALAANKDKARIFSFSVGDNADRPLMEALARSNRGRHFDLNDAQAVSELVLRVEELFEDIRLVRLTDLEFDFEGFGSSEVLPEFAPDLFSGGQVVVVGRYNEPGLMNLNIRARDNGSLYLLAQSFDAPALQEDNEFIKYLWATEQVGRLLADISRGGIASQLIEQITDIGLAYRIQTPYTSFSTPPPSGGGSGGGGGGWGGGGANGPLDFALVVLLLGGLAFRQRWFNRGDSQ